MNSDKKQPHKRNYDPQGEEYCSLCGNKVKQSELGEDGPCSKCPKRRLKSTDRVKRGDVVYWHDPDHGTCSRWDKVARGGTDEDIILLQSGTEVLIHELSIPL